jgi:hypothetical protein
MDSQDLHEHDITSITNRPHTITSMRPNTIVKPPSTTRPAITKRRRITPRSLMGIICMPSTTKSTRPRCTRKSTASSPGGITEIAGAAAEKFAASGGELPEAAS